VEEKPCQSTGLGRCAPDQRGLGYSPGGYEYRFISDELADAGIKASERRVWRLCSQQRIWAVFAKKTGIRPKAGPPVHDDLVKRNFTASRVNELWLTDITEHLLLIQQAGVATTP
jgi:transposase InsO family protein